MVLELVKGPQLDRCTVSELSSLANSQIRGVDINQEPFDEKPWFLSCYPFLSVFDGRTGSLYQCLKTCPQLSSMPIKEPSELSLREANERLL